MRKAESGNQTRNTVRGLTLAFACCSRELHFGSCVQDVWEESTRQTPLYCGIFRQRRVIAPSAWHVFTEHVL